MRHGLPLVLGCAGILVVLPLLASVGPAAGDPNERPRNVENSLSRLEQAVGLPNSDRSLAQRVDALERTLQDLTRATGGTPSQLSPEANARELQQAVREQRRRIDDLSQQLSGLQRSGHRESTGELGALESEVRDLRTSLSNIRRALDRLETRVERVESRK